MAEVVIGIGTSHSPQLSIRASDWDHLLKKDETDPRLDYPALLKKAKAGLAAELTPEKVRERDEACLQAVKDLGDALRRSKADVVVVFGDDQQEQFHDENMPMFAIYHGKSIPVVKDNKYRPSGWKDAERQGWAETAPEYDTAQDLANHLIGSLVEAEFDITRCNKLREEIGVGHAFSFLYRRILPGGKLPMVPVMVNTYYPPNQPTPKRCFDFGRHLAGVVGASPWNVGIIATGGLSHFPELSLPRVGETDTVFDRRLIHWMERGEHEPLQELTVDELHKTGEHEFLNWMVLLGAVAPARAQVRYFGELRRINLAAVEWSLP